MNTDLYLLVNLEADLMPKEEPTPTTTRAANNPTTSGPTNNPTSTAHDAPTTATTKPVQVRILPLTNTASFTTFCSRYNLMTGLQLPTVPHIS